MQWFVVGLLGCVLCASFACSNSTGRLDAVQRAETEESSSASRERNGLVVRLEWGALHTGLRSSKLAFLYDSSRSVRAEFLPPGWYTNVYNGASLGVEDPGLRPIMREGRLHAVEDAVGRFSFVYDARGMLEAVRGDSKEWRFQYSGDDLVGIALRQSGLLLGTLTISYEGSEVHTVTGDYLSFAAMYWNGREWQVIMSRGPCDAETLASLPERFDSDRMPFEFLEP